MSSTDQTQIARDIQLSAMVAGEKASHYAPKVGIVLGSGLGPFADTIEDPVIIPYEELPGFPVPKIGGHKGRLVVGKVGGTEVVAMQGRAHFYEGGNPALMKTPIRVMEQMGVETLLLTNAAGSLNANFGPGAIMLLSDYLNMTGASPLFFESDDKRFVDMVDCFDPELNTRFQEKAKELGIPLGDGVYAWMSGPQFETRAEIRALSLLGATAVGMSTVPEVILARHVGMKVAALSIITNFAAGMSPEALSHEHTKHHADGAAPDVKRLLTAFLTDLEV